MPKKPDRLPIHPAQAASAVSEYIQAAGFALIQIRQAVDMAEAASAPAEAKLQILSEAIRDALARVAAIMPED